MKIIIEIENGLVTGITSDKYLEFTIVDHDLLKTDDFYTAPETGLIRGSKNALRIRELMISDTFNKRKANETNH